MVKISAVFSRFRRTSQEADNEDSEENREVRPQVALALQHFVTNIGLGMSMGHSAVLLPQLKEEGADLQIDEETGSWIASVYMLVSPLGCFLGGVLLEKVGRRTGLLMGQCLYISGWALIASAQSPTMMICGRILDGIAVGVVGSAGAILFDEMAHPRLRVTVLCLASAFLSSGMLVMSSLGAFLHWRLAAALAAVPSILHIFILLFLVYETPVYFVKKNKLSQAEKSLKWLWGDRAAKVKKELDDLVARLHTRGNDEEKKDKEQHDICWKVSKILQGSKQYVEPYILKSFFIIHIFNLLQVPGGMGVITLYTIDILNAVQGDNHKIDGSVANIVMSALKVVTLLISAYLLYRLGRRPIAIISGVGSTLPALAVAVALYLGVMEAWLNVTLIVLYVLMNTLGFYTLTYTMIGELLPAKVRGFLFGYILALNYLVGGGVAKVYPWMLQEMGLQGMFLLFGVSCAACTIFVFLLLPETLGKTLEQIEDYFHQPNILWLSRNRNSEPKTSA